MPLNFPARALTAAALAATALAVPTGAHADSREPAPQETEITLITGDRVHYVDQKVVNVDRPDGAQGGVQVLQADGKIYVLPDEAVAGQLDLSLRTLQRRLRALMDLAGVRTRAQLGWHAARNNWA
ncbi:hypothetical protein [Nonomuraea sp. NPDC049784]|uniref:hypothetical protein n=1 Tax=Nonomuraea sp. NPDC049784 TaxID=3154361 RepID=UPI0033E4F217